EARSQYDLRLQVAQGRVDYTLGAEYRRQQGVNGKGNLAGLFVSVPLPIFNRNQGEIARAEAEHQKVSRSLVALETNVGTEAASAYAEFQSARGLLGDIERELLKPAAEARAGTAYVYQAGATSLLDVLDAQRAFNETMDAYYTAQAAYRRAEARLRLGRGNEPGVRPCAHTSCSCVSRPPAPARRFSPPAPAAGTPDRRLPPARRPPPRRPASRRRRRLDRHQTNRSSAS